MSALKSLGSKATRAISLAVVAVLVAGLVWFVFFNQPDTKKVGVDLASGVGIYPGTPVSILGITVGKVESVTPEPTHVHVVLSYGSKYKVPANASVLVVANSLVSDRYLQLYPVYKSGAVLADGATIPITRTAVPAELDDIYSALDRLSVSLGPNGVNKNGVLSDLMKVSAANLGGNGQNLGDSTTAMAKAVQALANSRTDLFATVTNLQKFNTAVQNSDAQVRHFEDMMAQVTTSLAADRADLGAALHNLSAALAAVSSFIKDNAASIHTDIVGLKNITGVLAKDKAAIDEVLAVGPVALANLVHGYQEPTGTLGTRSNLTLGLMDQPALCGFFESSGILINGLLGGNTGPVQDYCDALGKKTQIPVLPTKIQTQLKNVLPAMPGAS